MNAHTEIAELQKACLAATGKVEAAKRKKDGTIASKTSKAREARLALLKAEVDAGCCHPVPRPTPADHRSATDAYQQADQSLQAMSEDEDTLRWLQANKDKMQGLLDERHSWRKALCQAMGRVPGAFSAEFCTRQIKRINDAITKTRNALLMRDLKF
ncbi:hypothetical protein [Thalassospira aquimaris]|uniref:Lysozyme inhibitor LprI N-terminal domain-containing protein n=1 Tax=Thalassospira aquimaris TaxID=3037796 RepID=A0ABT6GGG1_9PROT|nr:hypothetical protein [Thalassospira sp. FZY0004]MDG4721177.1 hypothetical protein [Thalassospira sp. FZY0004]